MNFQHDIDCNTSQHKLLRFRYHKIFVRSHCKLLNTLPSASKMPFINDIPYFVKYSTHSTKAGFFFSIHKCISHLFKYLLFCLISDSNHDFQPYHWHDKGFYHADKVRKRSIFLLHFTFHSFFLFRDFLSRINMLASQEVQLWMNEWKVDRHNNTHWWNRRIIVKIC
jgi:hypothetical protein